MDTTRKKAIIEDWDLQCRNVKTYLIRKIYERINEFHQIECDTLEKRIIVYEVVNMFIRSSSRHVAEALDVDKNAMFSHGNGNPSDMQMIIANRIYESIKKDIWQLLKTTPVCL